MLGVLDSYRQAFIHTFCNQRFPLNQVWLRPLIHHLTPPREGRFHGVEQQRLAPNFHRNETVQRETLSVEHRLRSHSSPVSATKYWADSKKSLFHVCSTQKTLFLRL